MIQDRGDSVEYSLHKVPRTAGITIEGPGVEGQLSRPQDPNQPALYTLSATEPGVYPYRVQVKASEFEEQLRGTLISATWDVTFFKWTEDVDPRKDISAWRELAQRETAVSAEAKRLVFSYAWGGPSELNLSEAVAAAKLGGDHFGMIATTRLPLSSGTWELATLSDDGIRVTVDGRIIVEDWTWHGPTRHAGTFNLTADKTIGIRVEHFEIDGYATLELGISALPAGS
jgi:hypothetical protein